MQEIRPKRRQLPVAMIRGWHSDEVFIRIRSMRCYLWHVVDRHDVMLESLILERCDAKAAKRLFKRPTKGMDYAPRVIVTDKGARPAKLRPGDAPPRKG
jgi:transposase-like protein